MTLQETDEDKTQKEERPCEDREWSDAATGQGEPGAARCRAPGTEVVSSSAERWPGVSKISTLTAPHGGQRISHTTAVNQMPVTVTSLTSNQPDTSRLRAKREGSNRG